MVRYVRDVRLSTFVSLIGAVPLFVQLVSPHNLHACEELSVKPNLRKASATRVTGELRDPSGAVIPRTRLELRDYISGRRQDVRKRALTDEQGVYPLGVVPAGAYRLVVFRTRLSPAYSEDLLRRRLAT